MSENSITRPEDHEDFLQAMTYVQNYEKPVLKKGESRPTIQDIADMLGMSRQNLHKKRDAWQKSGLLALCRQKFFAPTFMATIEGVYHELYQAWPEIMRRQIMIALNSPSDKTANEAAQWLNEMFVQPMLDEVEPPGNEELAYVEEIMKDLAQISPMDIPRLEDGDN